MNYLTAELGTLTFEVGQSRKTVDEIAKRLREKSE
jgi:hypothetical protein